MNAIHSTLRNLLPDRDDSGAPRRLLLTGIALWALMLTGCELQNQSPQQADAGSKSGKRAEPSHWITHENAYIVTAASTDDDPALAEAIEQARQTLDEARQTWRNQSERKRQRWAVKWIATTEDGEKEYLWVQPLHWSRFRIEGVLLNQPTEPLLSGHSRGDTVGFAVDEVADWVYHDPAENASDDELRGGYTIRALEQNYGPVPDDDGASANASNARD